LNTIPVTVLITTANKPPAGMPLLQMTDPVTRTIAAKAALYFWIAQGVEQIVLADATETNLLSAQEEEEIDKTETRVEQISYKQPSAEVIRKGKGYAEGKLIEYAINNSELLAREEYFFKCTGKVYVRNFPKIVEGIRANRLSSLFWKYLGDGAAEHAWADCRFYYTSKNFARNCLIPAYLASDDREAACEYYVQEALSRNMRVGRVTRPFLTGYCGGSGEPYFDLSLGALDNNYPCWLTQR
jgi:hypothetical protein